MNGPGLGERAFEGGREGDGGRGESCGDFFACIRMNGGGENDVGKWGKCI